MRNPSDSSSGASVSSPRIALRVPERIQKNITDDQDYHHRRTDVLHHDGQVEDEADCDDHHDDSSRGEEEEPEENFNISEPLFMPAHGQTNASPLSSNVKVSEMTTPNTWPISKHSNPFLPSYAPQQTSSRALSISSWSDVKADQIPSKNPCSADQWCIYTRSSEDYLDIVQGSGGANPIEPYPLQGRLLFLFHAESR